MTSENMVTSFFLTFFFLNFFEEKGLDLEIPAYFWWNEKLVQP